VFVIRARLTWRARTVYAPAVLNLCIPNLGP
jgi:hypothetical protein